MDGKYIVFLDYDRMPLEWVETELQRLQSDFSLGNFYVFESSKDSYHAVCFDKLTLGEYVTVLKNSSVDPKYIDVPLNWGKKIWTLRLTDKEKPIKFIKTILTPQFRKTREQSNAHKQVVALLFDLKIPLTNPDEFKEVCFAQYTI